MVGRLGLFTPYAHCGPICPFRDNLAQVSCSTSVAGGSA